MSNHEIKEIIKKNRLFHYEIAKELGISEPSFSKWLRDEMDIHRKEQVLQAIKRLKTEETKCEK